jgi:palmitoyltransferase
MAFLWVGCIYVACVSYGIFNRHRRWLANTASSLPADEYTELLLLARAGYLNSYADFSFLLTAAVAVALGLLLGWHVYLVSTAQTNIEIHANRAAKQSASLKHERWAGNPYDHGLSTNWRLFLGIVDGRGWGCALLPSSHGPVGDGTNWDRHREGVLRQRYAPHDV